MYCTLQYPCTCACIKLVSVVNWLMNLLSADILSRLKIVCLEKNRDDARKKYRSHKSDYVKMCLGRPLDKLSVSLLLIYLKWCTYSSLLLLGFL